MPMRRNRFDEIMSFVHLVDNMKITADPFFKVRPLFECLNDINNRIPIAEHVTVDEMMIEYFGRHVCKQFIRGKPIRFGYKIWSLASSSGFVHQMEPYAGRHTGLVETGLGQGPSVVLGLAKKADVPPGVKFYHDNLFTTLPCWMRWPWEAMATVARCDKISSITFPSQQPRPSRNWGEEMEQTEAEHGRGQTAQVYPRLQHTHGRSGPAWPVCQPLQSQHPFQEVVVAMLQLGPEQCHGEQLVLLQVHKAICYLVISQLSLWCLTR